MDYRDQIAHLIEHMELKPTFLCERRCPVGQSMHGGIVPILSYPGRQPSYEGPSVSIILELMTKMGLAVQVVRGAEQEGWGQERYYPTPHGIDYLRKYRHPAKYWFCSNWLPASVAGATILASLVSTVAYVVSILD